MPVISAMHRLTENLVCGETREKSKLSGYKSSPKIPQDSPVPSLNHFEQPNLSHKRSASSRLRTTHPDRPFLTSKTPSRPH